MSVIDDTAMHQRCDGCDEMTFDPSPCAGCEQEGHKGLRFGAGCSSVCSDCNEIFCHEHKDPTKACCNACRTAEDVSTGVAFNNWNWGRDY